MTDSKKVESKQTILIIEDSLTYQQALRRAFIEAGYHCICALTGEEGLALIKEARPSLIVLDLMLPGISGREVCRELKMNINYRHTPVMMLTMQKEDKAVVEGLEAGADTYVNKNESLDVIIRRAEALIKLNAVIVPVLLEEAGIKEEEPEFKNKRILLVDDDITYLQAIKRELKGTGYEVTTAASGEECFLKLMEQVPDLVLLDLRMPEIDGADVCRKIRTIKKYQNLPVVMLTGSDSQEDVVRGFEAGITDYVIKSGDFKIIHLRINSILRRRHFEEETQKIRAKFTDAERRTLIANVEKEAERKFAEELAVKNQALINSAQELKRSNEDLERFAYIASHDLQEPLRMVASFTQLLERKYKDQLDAQAQEYIAFAVDGAKRMQNLVDDLLSFSKVGQKNAPRAIVDLNAICKQALSDMTAKIDEHQAVINIDPLPTLLANETQMFQLFLNLISNGLKYRGERSPAIRVTVQKIKDHEWQFSVSDNGIGIDEKYFGKLFIIFQRLPTKKVFKGTGIGLALCKKIVENYDGRIWVESKVGEGTTFHFTLKEGESA